MFYSEVSSNDLFNALSPIVQWETLQPPLNTQLFCPKTEAALVHYLNPWHIAWVNIISKTECQDLLSLDVSDQLELTRKMKQLGGIWVVCDNLVKTNHILKQWLIDSKIDCFFSRLPAQEILNILTPYLYHTLAQQRTLHGTLIEVETKGVFLRGASGVGKSTTALRCLERGHRLIADDAPSFFRLGTQVIGRCPSEIQNLLAIKATGLIKVTERFPSHTTRIEHALDLIVQIDDNDGARAFNNLFIDTETLFGLEFPKIQLAFTQNIAILIEQVILYLLNRPT